MNNFFSLFFLILKFTFSVSGQISVTRVAPAKEDAVEPYDSLVNFLGLDYKRYKGQTLMVLPKSPSLREFGYDNFFIKLDDTGLRNNSNVYKCCESFNSKYQELENVNFLVLDAYKPMKSSILYDAVLQLKNLKTNDIVYYTYNSKYDHSFPFLVLGYLEKCKQLFINKKVLIRNFKVNSDPKGSFLYDINTGEKVYLKSGEYLDCFDITLDEKNFKPSLLLTNQSGNTVLFPLHTRHLNIMRVLTYEEAEHYKSIFGETNWSIIVREGLEFGFTEEMVKFSWGEPDKINYSSSRNQWVYGDTYLYFENGIFTSYN